jgi:uncharacterized C2H2 Zn-finger protein
MGVYKCNRCNKLFKLKGDYNRHISRKFPCKSDNKTLDSVDETAKIEPQKSTKMEKNPHKNTENVKNLVDEELEDDESKKVCNHCKKVFSREDSLRRHITKHCKVKASQDNEKESLLQKLLEEMRKQNNQMEKQNKQMEEMKEKMERKDEDVTNLKMEIERLKSKGSRYIKVGTQQKNRNNTNIGTQQNTTIENQQNNQQNIQINNNNIKLLAFGSEDMSYVVDEVYKRILNKGFKSVPTFVQYLHFNKDNPQNHNVYISNMQTNYAIVYDGEDWKLKERDSVLQQLVDDKTGILSVKFDELLDSLDEPTVRKFRRFIDQSDENEVVSKMKSDLKLVLYNNRRMAEKTKQRLCPPGEPNMIDKK